MTPQQFVASLDKQTPAPVYLFLGPELYRRGVCRRKLLERMLLPEERESGFIRHDLDEVSLDEVIDDASSMSLFAPKRLIWVTSAESALPRGRGAADASDAAEPAKGAEAHLARYLRSPAPDVVLVFDARRFHFEGEDKAKIERVRKFYAAIPAVVEFAPLDEESSRRLAQDLARRAKLDIGAAEIELLIEALGHDGARIAAEIEKLSLYAGEGRRITVSDIAVLAPNARSATVFNLVNALGRKDRAASFDLLDTLVREGEYLPLALTFLATQFRFALVAREEGLKSPQQIQAHFTRLGVPMWQSRAQQVYQTVSAFPAGKIEQALLRLAHADRALRDARPDDRVVLEELVIRLTE